MALTNLMYKNVHFDSDEEVFFAMWAEELKQVGLIYAWTKNIHELTITEGLKIDYIKTTKLKTKIKTEQKVFTLLRPSVYTTDFVLRPCLTTKHIRKIFQSIASNPKVFDKNAPLFCDQNWLTYVEVKPSFDQQNMERLFVNNQKFIWDKYKMFVNLVEPVELFKKTFLPSEAAPYFRYKVISKKAAAKGKVKGDFKFDWTPRTINEFLNA